MCPCHTKYKSQSVARSPPIPTKARRHRPRLSRGPSAAKCTPPRLARLASILSRPRRYGRAWRHDAAAPRGGRAQMPVRRSTALLAAGPAVGRCGEALAGGSMGGAVRLKRLDARRWRASSCSAAPAAASKVRGTVIDRSAARHVELPSRAHSFLQAACPPASHHTVRAALAHACMRHHARYLSPRLLPT